MTIQTREMYFNSELQTRATEDDEKIIEGYFIRYNAETELAPGMFEEINPTAVSRSLANNDIYSLYNHQSQSPLGRTGNGTLKLKSDEHGLWGTLRLNENDPEAMSVYAKIQRNDISGCSFGFIPLDEDVQHRDDGSVKFVVRDADIREVSICTFPAYPQTSISAREQDFEQHKQRMFEAKKQKLKERLSNE